jgi:hypothetical protein
VGRAPPAAVGWTLDANGRYTGRALIEQDGYAYYDVDEGRQEGGTT